MSGTVQGVGELQVTVNGTPAVVTCGVLPGPSVSAEGENLLVVEATDARDQTARRERSVILDTKPRSETLMPPAGS